MSKVFFGNSGAEANEGAIQAARKYSVDHYGKDRYNVITLVNSFHGRTLATLTATGQGVFHNYFGPFNEGFLYAPAGDIEALQELVDRNTCAVMLELMSKEIEFQELEIELCNKKIREGMAKMREREFDLHKAEEKKADLEHGLVEKRAELEDILEETHEEEERLKEKALELEKKIEPRLLASFKRIRKGARNGLGIVYVQRDACGGCFNKIPPQRQLDIKMHKKIIPCEYCGRILIDPELAGVKIETPNTEEKPKRKRISRRKKAEDAE